MKNTQVSKVLFDNKTALGVELETKGNTQQIRCRNEVILSAGAIGSPQLLQLSGIGPAEVLQNANVKLIHELPGVGKNLQDHLEVFFQYQCKQAVSLNRKLGLFSKALIGAQWLMFKTGLGATNHFESCAFIRSHESKQWPDIQYHFLPAAMSYDGNVAFKGDGYQVHVGPNKPKSRGTVQIQSPRWQDHPAIQFNYLQAHEDVEDWRRVIRITRNLMQQAAFDDYREKEIQPGLDVLTDEQIDHWVRQNVETAYHPSCTCKIGADDDDMAVLNSECQVRGVAGLRVVDSSIFPTITNGNLNAPSMMVAEKAADIILGLSATLAD